MKVTHLSVSQVQDWLRCPTLWAARRVYHWEQPPSAAMEVGKVIHEALSAYHDGGDAELALLAGWQKLVEAGLTKEYSGQDLFTVLRHYCAVMSPEPGDQTEVGFRVKVPGIPAPLIGYMDLVRGNVVHEFKSGKWRWGQAKADGELQATLYHYAFQEVYGHPPEQVVYHALLLGRVPAVYQLVTQRTPEQVEKALDLVRRVYQEIKEAKDGDLIPSCTGSGGFGCRYVEQCAERGYQAPAARDVAADGAAQDRDVTRLRIARAVAGHGDAGLGEAVAGV